MRDRVKTLLIYANGTYSWRSILADTTLRGVLRFRRDASEFPEWIRRLPLVPKIFGNRNEILGYVNDWKDAFCQFDELHLEACNLLNLVHYRRCLKQIDQYELIVLLHSATGNNMPFLLKSANAFQYRKGKLLVLIGNEYDFMPQKLGFLKASAADFVGSQLPIAVARWLYEDCAPTKILATPHALNPNVYFPDPKAKRDVDVGFIGSIYHAFIGDSERTELIDYFRENHAALGLTCDIRTQRLTRTDWAAFLNTCWGIIGAESGTYYLEKTDETNKAVKAYLKVHPQASLFEIHKRFFKHLKATVSGKAISSRHFEPIGTQTCQILFEGAYNDILIADQHYISLKKDFSNIQDVVARFKDEAYRTTIAHQAYELVLNRHTYRHRVEFVLKTLFPTAGFSFN